MSEQKIELATKAEELYNKACSHFEGFKFSDWKSADPKTVKYYLALAENKTCI